MEPTTSCNLRCPECPSGLRSFTRPTGMLTLDAFKQTVDQLDKDLIYLLMYFQGEPYLNKDFLAMATYSAEKRIYTATSTNGHYLNDENARKTVESGIHEVLISIDGTTQEVYKQYRVGGSLAKALEGVKNLVKWREELKSPTPLIIIQFLVVGPNEHQIGDIQRMGDELGADKVLLKTAQIYDYQQGSPLIPSQDRYSRYKRGKSGAFEIKSSMKNQCWRMWMGSEITWDGRVLPCCFDKDATHELGKVPEQKFPAIWRGKAYQSFRQSLLKSRSEIEICRNCSEGLDVWG